MTSSELKKITLIIFHCISLMLLFLSISLILDQIFTRNINLTPFKLSFEIVLALITIFIASISWLVIITEWLQKSTLEYYLKSILLAESILMPLLVLILIIQSSYL